MFGKNKILKQELTPGPFWVQEIFYTIQGEGPFTGESAIFVRLGGCNLKCYFCDTDFESSKQHLTAAQILEECQKYSSKLVVITGGEPFRQNLAVICEELLRHNFRIQIETAGTLWQEEFEELMEEGDVTIVCSPKTGKVHPKIAEYCYDWKYIIQLGAVDPEDGLPNESTQKEGAYLKIFSPPWGITWLQPMAEYLPDGSSDEEKTTRNMHFAAELCMRHNYRLTLQTHKILGLP